MTPAPSLAQWRGLLRRVRYRTVTAFVGRAVTVRSLATLPGDVAAGLGLPAGVSYAGRWNRDGAADTAYTFGALGFFDVRYRLPATLGGGPAVRGRPLLDQMGVSAWMDPQQVAALVAEVEADANHLLLLLHVDANHTLLSAFRAALRRGDPAALATGRGGLPAGWFPVRCTVRDAAETNAPHLWQYRHDALWFYTYLY